MDPKACIDDDIYKELSESESFLRQGRGRPKALRDLVFDGKTTKKLLVQFAYLKDEGLKRCLCPSDEPPFKKSKF